MRYAKCSEKRQRVLKKLSSKWNLVWKYFSFFFFRFSPFRPLGFLWSPGKQTQIFGWLNWILRSAVWSASTVWAFRTGLVDRFGNDILCFFLWREKEGRKRASNHKVRRVELQTGALTMQEKNKQPRLNLCSYNFRSTQTSALCPTKLSQGLMSTCVKFQPKTLTQHWATCMLVLWHGAHTSQFGTNYFSPKLPKVTFRWEFVNEE